MMEAANNNKLLQQDIKENEKKFSNNKEPVKKSL